MQLYYYIEKYVLGLKKKEVTTRQNKLKDNIVHLLFTTLRCSMRKYNKVYEHRYKLLLIDSAQRINDFGYLSKCVQI